jgi:hypothetical protein
MPRFEFILQRFGSAFARLIGLDAPAAGPAGRSALMKDRPERLRRELNVHYEMDAGELFDRIRRRVYDFIDETPTADAPQFFREYGNLADGRRFFYVKKPGEAGWIFEATDRGWLIARGEHIPAQNTFIRRGAPWDLVQVGTVERHLGNGKIPVVVSERLGTTPISFLIYEDKLRSELGIARATR